jgi:hypothetical protein
LQTQKKSRPTLRETALQNKQNQLIKPAFKRNLTVLSHQQTNPGCFSYKNCIKNEAPQANAASAAKYF